MIEYSFDGKVTKILKEYPRLIEITLNAPFCIQPIPYLVPAALMDEFLIGTNLNIIIRKEE